MKLDISAMKRFHRLAFKSYGPIMAAWHTALFGIGMVTLRCPDCGRTKIVAREPDDPEIAAVFVGQCDKCEDAG